MRPLQAAGDGTRTVGCDVLVIGSGAAGLSAAITARSMGLDVVVAEKEACFGGASARSGGWLWIPGNAVGAPSPPRIEAEETEAARAYIRHHAGAFFDAERVQAFLENGPAMVEFFRNNTAVRLVPVEGFPDYHPDTPGAALAGRSITSAPFDGRALGREIKRLRPPMKTATFMGMMIGTLEMAHFLKFGRSLTASLHVVRRLIRHAWDLATCGRTMWLLNGNALVASLARSAFDMGIPIWTSAPARRLLMTAGAVTGAVIERDGLQVEVHARRAVILASGGFPHDTGRREALAPWAQARPDSWLVLPVGNSGDGLAMGEQAGGYVSDRVANSVALGPITPFTRAVGGEAAFPLLAGRQKPGMIAVTRAGQRFVNEANSYHDFGIGFLQANRGAQDPAAFFICDHATIRRYGLGFAKPFPLPLGPHIDSGYLTRAPTIRELAGRLGIPADALQATVDGYNLDARRGDDPQFGRGGNAYNRVQGDAAVLPNPCVAPLMQGPFYAVKVVLGALGTFAGLATDGNAQVVDHAGTPIAGLYAVGNDMLSVMGGDYVGGGTTIGPGMTFGYVAARHAASATVPMPVAPERMAA